MLFDAFLRATGEPPFDVLAASCTECYRLSIKTSLGSQHRVYRLQRSTAGGSCFLAHFLVFGTNRGEARAKTHEMQPEEPLWRAFDALLAAARFWELPAEQGRVGFDGSTYTMEAWKGGRRHKVARWSPNPIFSGGELFAVISDYLERLGELACLECDSEMRERYAPEYVPFRQDVSKGNLT